MLISAHAGYPRLLDSGADFVEIDVRRDERGEIVDSHDPPRGTAPQLDQILHAVKSRGLGLHLDIKEPGFEDELIRRVLAVLPAGKVVATPDYEESIRAIKRKYSQVRVSPIDFVTVNQSDPIPTLEGKPVWIWTVDERRRISQLMKDPRIECIITNRPELVLKLRKARE